MLRRLLTLAFIVVASCSKEAYLKCNSRVCTRASSKATATAVGSYKATVNQTGWGEVKISSNREAPDFDQAFAAGYAEAVLTADLIHQQWLNTYNSELAPERNGTLYATAIDFVEVHSRIRDFFFSKSVNSGLDSPTSPQT